MVVSTSEQRLRTLIERLRARGYRLTPQRLAILQVLLRDSSHPSAEQVFAQVRRLYPTISLATVYSTLHVLKELGELLEIDCHEGFSRYDGRQPQPHGHIRCLVCRRVDDLPLGEGERLAQAVAAQTGYQEVRPQLLFTGICPRCQGGAEGEA